MNVTWIAFLAIAAASPVLAQEPPATREPRSLGPSRDGYRGTTRFGWYGWLGVDARAVARNIFLDGNTFHDGPHVERRPYGNDLQAGLALAWQTARIGFTFVRRSREFNAQDKPDRFGQLSLSFAY
jgi:lipid A 3-O-deacylase